MKVCHCSSGQRGSLPATYCSSLAPSLYGPRPLPIYGNSHVIGLLVFIQELGLRRIRGYWLNCGCVSVDYCLSLIRAYLPIYVDHVGLLTAIQCNSYTIKTTYVTLPPHILDVRVLPSTYVFKTIKPRS